MSTPAAASERMISASRDSPASRIVLAVIRGLLPEYELKGFVAPFADRARQRGLHRLFGNFPAVEHGAQVRPIPDRPNLKLTTGYEHPTIGHMAEVIVIGAGPAGSAAAMLLARHGVRVTLVEQHRFPRDKVCGECLSATGAKEKGSSFIFGEFGG